MNISLNPHLEEFINQQLATGRYSSASEIVREGLRLLEERELKIIELRKEIQNGLGKGQADKWDKDTFLKGVHQKAKEQGINPDE